LNTALERFMTHTEGWFEKKKKQKKKNLRQPAVLIWMI